MSLLRGWKECALRLRLGSDMQGPPTRWRLQVLPPHCPFHEELSHGKKIGMGLVSTFGIADDPDHNKPFMATGVRNKVSPYPLHCINRSTHACPSSFWCVALTPSNRVRPYPLYRTNRSSHVCPSSFTVLLLHPPNPSVTVVGQICSPFRHGRRRWDGLGLPRFSCQVLVESSQAHDLRCRYGSHDVRCTDETIRNVRWKRENRRY